MVRKMEITLFFFLELQKHEKSYILQKGWQKSVGIVVQPPQSQSGHVKWRSTSVK